MDDPVALRWNMTCWIHVYTGIPIPSDPRRSLHHASSHSSFSFQAAFHLTSHPALEEALAVDLHGGMRLLPPWLGILE